MAMAATPTRRLRRGARFRRAARRSTRTNPTWCSASRSSKRATRRARLRPSTTSRAAQRCSAGRTSGCCGPTGSIPEVGKQGRHGDPLRPFFCGSDMNLALGFVPFILFAVLMRLSTDLALWVAFAAAFTLGMRSFLDTRVLKTLDAGNTALFGLLALYKGFIQPSLSFGALLLAVDGGLLAIILASIVLHEPFTLQYAREQVSQ